MYAPALDMHRKPVFKKIPYLSFLLFAIFVVMSTLPIIL